MPKIATPQEIAVDREQDMVCLHIRGGGTLKMPRDAAHALCQGIMAEIGVIDRLYPRERWPNLRTKG